MVDWFWYYNPYFEFLTGFAKPKEANRKWAMHLFKKQDPFTCGGQRNMQFNLSSSFILKLEKTFYNPSFFRNLISISRLVPFGYSFNFSETSFSLVYKSDLVGNSTLSDGLFFVNLQSDATYNAMHVQAGIKRCVMNENSICCDTWD